MAQLVVPRSMPTMKRCVTRVPIRRLRLRRERRPCGRSRAAAAGRAAPPPSRDGAGCRGYGGAPAALPTTLMRAGSLSRSTVTVLPSSRSSTGARLAYLSSASRQPRCTSRTAAPTCASWIRRVRSSIRKSTSRPSRCRIASSCARDRSTPPGAAPRAPARPARPAAGQSRRGCRRRSGRGRSGRRRRGRRTSSVSRGRSFLRLYCVAGLGARTRGLGTASAGGIQRQPAARAGRLLVSDYHQLRPQPRIEPRARARAPDRRSGTARQHRTPGPIFRPVGPSLVEGVGARLVVIRPAQHLEQLGDGGESPCSARSMACCARKFRST